MHARFASNAREWLISESAKLKTSIFSADLVGVKMTGRPGRGQFSHDARWNVLIFTPLSVGHEYSQPLGFLVICDGIDEFRVEGCFHLALQSSLH